MSGFKCPYCSEVMPVTKDTTSQFKLAYEGFDQGPYMNGGYYHSTCNVIFFKCPSCGEYTISIQGMGDMVQDVDVKVKPQSTAIQFPDYIPKAIRQDYEEACSIVDLSPKASATLSRRCLQGMIRDFFEIEETNLAKAIQALEGKIPAPQWRVIDGVRRIGNIGAHMEKDINLIVDIEPNEAQKLIKLIEHLLEPWYINRHEQELLYADIIGIDENKQSTRKKPE